VAQSYILKTHHTTMANQISETRRRFTYLEEKDVYEILKQTAKKNGLEVSALVRIATANLIEKIEAHPNARFINPIFE
jgi:hypothetical protein